VSVLTERLHDPPSRLSVIGAELRLLLRQYRWTIPLLFLAYFVAEHWLLLYDSQWLDYLIRFGSVITIDLSDPDRYGAVWTGLYLHTFIKAVTAGLWGYLIWRDTDAVSIHSSITDPISGTFIRISRLFLGALILMAADISAWYLGTGINGLLVNVTGLVAGFLPPAIHAARFLSYVNVFLLASLICLTTRRPLVWFFIYLPAIGMLFFLLQLFANVTPVREICLLLLSPYGLSGGLYIETWTMAGELIEPAVLAPVIWFPVLLGATLFAAARHRDS